jgi:hypothetical protein
VDDFEDGTLQGWSGGLTLSNEPSGGPGDSRFLQLDSFNNLGTYNLLNWGGDYPTSGVTAIEADFHNPGDEPLSLRLVLFSGDNERTTSTQAVMLQPDNQWHRLSFSTSAADLTHVLGSSSTEAILANVDRLLFRHQSGAPASGGSPIVAMLGIDNITAVPEPATAMLLAAGALLIARRSARG